MAIHISQRESQWTLLAFLGLNVTDEGEFPHLNIGKQVDNWKEYKHPNKIHSLSAGKEHRKFFDYQ